MLPNLHYSPSPQSVQAGNEAIIPSLPTLVNYTPSVNLRSKVLSPFFVKFFVSVPNYIDILEQPWDEFSYLGLLTLDFSKALPSIVSTAFTLFPTSNCRITWF